MQRYFRHGSVEAVQFLLSKCRVDCGVKDRRGRTALDYAKRFQHAQVIAILTGTDQNTDYSYEGEELETNTLDIV